MILIANNGFCTVRFEACDARIDRRLQQGHHPGSEDDALLAPATLLPLGSRALLQNTALRQVRADMHEFYF